MSEHNCKHWFLTDLQPLRGRDPVGAWLCAALNWAALFGLFYVAGRALRLGWGL